VHSWSPVVTFLVPQVGVGMTMVLVIVGQLVSGVLMDTCGFLGSPVHTFSTTHAFACQLLIGGMICLSLTRCYAAHRRAWEKDYERQSEISRHTVQRQGDRARLERQGAAN